MTAPTGLQARVRVTLPRLAFRLPDDSGWVVFPNMPMSQWQKVLRRRGWKYVITWSDEVPS